MLDAIPRHTRVLLFVMLAASLLALVGAPTAYAAETTTTTAPVDATTATTAPADATTATTADATGATSTVVGASLSSAVTPAGADYQPLNPGLTATDMAFQVWPEYDTGDVLVLIDLTLPADTQFPYTFSFYAPNGARLTGIAEVDSNGQFVYKMAPPQITQGTDWEQVTITVPSIPRLRLEYYYDPGVAASGQKSFDVTFKAPADVASLGVGVQQPLRSTDFSVSPALAQTSTDSGGFNYALDTLSGIKQGDEVTLHVSYTKPDSEPSVQNSTTSGTSANSSSNYLLYMLIALIVAVVAVVAYRMFLRPRTVPAGGRGRGGGAGRAQRGSGGTSARAREGGGSSGTASAGPARYCTQCGARLTKKDRFCPQCGHEREQ